MWIKRIATFVIVTTVAAAGATAPAARAGGPGAPIMGDFDGDGFRDIADLGAVVPDLCSVIVQQGSGPGVYLPPIAFVYARPGGSAGTACPDIGTAFDADGDPGDELWIGWSTDAPPTLSYNRLVIDHNFRTIGTFHSPINPTFLGTADFTGSGRKTAFSVGRGGFATYATVGGAGALGPQRWCSADPPAFQLQDVNGNRAMDALLSYTKGCADGGNGVVVLLDDGTVRQLEIDPAGAVAWRSRMVRANDDRFPDVRTENLATGETNYFIGRAGGGFVLGPRANTDTVFLANAKPLAIDVLANDYASSDAEVVITVPPRYGTAQVLSDKRILYRPRPTHGRTDKFTYQLRRDHRRSSASVYLRFPQTG